MNARHEEVAFSSSSCWAKKGKAYELDGLETRTASWGQFVIWETVVLGMTDIKAKLCFTKRRAGEEQAKRCTAKLGGFAMKDRIENV